MGAISAPVPSHSAIPFVPDFVPKLFGLPGRDGVHGSSGLLAHQRQQVTVAIQRKFHRAMMVAEMLVIVFTD
jgi:hypothetical protein